MRKPRVFITQENPNLNYLPAEQFGEIVFLTRDDFSPVKNSLHNEALMTDLRTKLKDFNPKADFITVSGSPVVSGAVFLILGSILPDNTTINLLRWSNRDHVYQPIAMDLK